MPNSMIYKLKTTASTVSIDPQGAYVTAFAYHDQPILFPDQTLAIAGQTKRRGGMPILFPWADELPNLPRHGFGRDLPWSVQAALPDQLSLALTSSAQTLALYPYRFTADYHLSLVEASLILALTIVNTDTQAIPVAPGFHPYFNLPPPPDYKLGITLHSPLGTSTLKIQNQSVTLRPQGSFLNPHSTWAYWSDSPSYYCIEPWSAPSGGLVQPGLAPLIPPGHQANFTFSLTVGG